MTLILVSEVYLVLNQNEIGSYHILLDAIPIKARPLNNATGSRYSIDNFDEKTRVCRLNLVSIDVWYRWMVLI